VGQAGSPSSADRPGPAAPRVRLRRFVPDGRRSDPVVYRPVCRCSPPKLSGTGAGSLPPRRHRRAGVHVPVWADRPGPLRRAARGRSTS